MQQPFCAYPAVSVHRKSHTGSTHYPVHKSGSAMCTIVTSISACDSCSYCSLTPPKNCTRIPYEKQRINSKPRKITLIKKQLNIRCVFHNLLSAAPHVLQPARGARRPPGNRRQQPFGQLQGLLDCIYLIVCYVGLFVCFETYVQGDHSGFVKPPVDTKTNVAIQ